MGVISAPFAAEHAQSHGVRILVAELEDVADFDGLVKLQCRRRRSRRGRPR